MCNCPSDKCCPECVPYLDQDALIDPKDREDIDKEYKVELKVLALKAAFLEFSHSCNQVVVDGNGYREFDDRFDNFDFRAKEKFIGDVEKYKAFKKLLENF